MNTSKTTNINATRIFVLLNFLCCMVFSPLFSMEDLERAEEEMHARLNRPAEWAKKYFQLKMDSFNPNHITLYAQTVSDQQCKMFLDFAKRVLVRNLGKCVEQHEQQFKADELFIESLKQIEKGAIDIVKNGITGSTAQSAERTALKHFVALNELITLSGPYFLTNEVVLTIKAKSLEAQQVLKRSITAQENMKDVPLGNSITHLTSEQSAIWREMGDARTALKSFFDSLTTAIP